jgi:hypothetical protein
MEVGERGTLGCPAEIVLEIIPSVPVTFAEISLTVTFNPAFTWTQLHREFRFVTKRDSNGVLHWFPPTGAIQITKLLHESRRSGDYRGTAGDVRR